MNGVIFVFCFNAYFFYVKKWKENEKHKWEESKHFCWKMFTFHFSARTLRKKSKKKILEEECVASTLCPSRFDVPWRTNKFPSRTITISISFNWAPSCHSGAKALALNFKLVSLIYAYVCPASSCLPDKHTHTHSGTRGVCILSPVNYGPTI